METDGTPRPKRAGGPDWLMSGARGHFEHLMAGIAVADLEAELAGLAARDIVSGVPETAPGVFIKAVLLDPDGNRIQLGQDLTGG
jgi:hypothetical protein